LLVGPLVEKVKVAKKFSKTQSNIFLQGDTGTGKEIFAQSIHNTSSRKNGPFVAVNCGALSESLLESELFGYVKGAFTGASKDGKAGYFELAHKGTIFLDEIGELPFQLQSRLLRVIQEREIKRLGDEKVIPIDVRIIAATNQNLHSLIAQSKFREDLFYRLQVLKIRIPSLRERKTDIPLLAENFINRFKVKEKKEIIFTSSAKESLMQYEFYGNIRQLENVCERLVIMCDRELTQDTVQMVMDEEESTKFEKDVNIYDNKKDYYQRVLEEVQYNKQLAADKLGISRTTLWRRLNNKGEKDKY